MTSETWADSRSEVEAATKLQAAWRGKMARNEVAFKLRMKAAASRMPEIDGMDDLLAGLLDEEDEWQEGGEEEAPEAEEEVPIGEEMQEQQEVEVEVYAEDAVEELTEAVEEAPKEKKRKKKKKKEKEEAQEEVQGVNQARMGSNVKLEVSIGQNPHPTTHLLCGHRISKPGSGKRRCSACRHERVW